ncbi:MAG TPA: protein kinase [Gemmatimonadaceae bacterium]|nr:protein kinase [Gemmatimonadaceae bacterium]
MIEPADRLASALADRYRIERELGKGGMATVYLAQDLRHGRKVAVKVLLPELAAVLGAERFLSEIHVTAALQHPHILPLFDSGQADGQLFYVMPFVEGESLRSRLDRERQLPIADALRICREVGSALGYAHRHGVIHRDIKPENILLQEGHALVADFGIALAVTSAGGGRLTQTGLSLGTPQYMSPEQATGEREIDARSDLYSLAAVTYEMLGGEPPHTGTTMQAVIARMLTERPRNVRSMRSSVPENVANALDVALERIPADRWNSIEEFEQAIDGKVTPAKRSSGTLIAGTGRTGAEYRSRLKDPVTLALAGIAFVALLIAAAAIAMRRTPVELPTARFLITLPKGTEFALLTQDAFALSPDGKLIAFAARDSTLTPRIFLRAIGDTRVTPLPGTEGVINVWFSPDGRWLGFAGASGIRKISIATHDIVDVAGLNGVYGGTTWSPSGNLVISANNARLFVVPQNGGTERKLCNKSGDEIISQTEPLALADGETILFSGSKSNSIAAQRLGVGSLRTGDCKLLDVPMIHALGVADGIVVFANLSGVIMAAPFDERSKKIEGSAIPLVSDVDVNQTTGTAQASMSLTGSLVYLTANASTELMKVDAGGVAGRLFPDVRTYAYPRYSPNGKKIAVAVAVTAQRDIWVIDPQAGTMSRLTSGGYINDRPEWSPDGRRVLFRTSRGTRSAIWWRSADLSDEESALLTNDKEDYYEAVMTPDGSSVVYQVDTAGADVVAQSLTGQRKKTAIAASPFIEDMARLSPDGKWVAYVSDASGSSEVFVQPFPGAGPRVQVSSRGGDEPVWARDGSRIFYRDGRNVVAVSFRTAPEFEVTGRRELFPDIYVKRSLPHANYDVSPDGSSFLFLRETSDKEAVVIYNWLPEVRSRLKESREAKN